MEAALLAVFDHYDLPEPGWGERPIRCPVHDDSVASASVNRAKGLWNCHACGKGGSAVQIVMEREHLEYRPALAFVEGLTGGSLKSMPRTQHRSKTRTRWVPPRLRRAM